MAPSQTHLGVGSFVPFESHIESDSVLLLDEPTPEFPPEPEKAPVVSSLARLKSFLESTTEGVDTSATSKAGSQSDSVFCDPELSIISYDSSNVGVLLNFLVSFTRFFVFVPVIAHLYYIVPIMGRSWGCMLRGTHCPPHEDKPGFLLSEIRLYLEFFSCMIAVYDCLTVGTGGGVPGSQAFEQRMKLAKFADWMGFPTFIGLWAVRALVWSTVILSGLYDPDTGDESAEVSFTGLWNLMHAFKDHDVEHVMDFITDKDMLLVCAMLHFILTCVVSSSASVTSEDGGSNYTLMKPLQFLLKLVPRSSPTDRLAHPWLEPLHQRDEESFEKVNPKKWTKTATAVATGTILFFCMVIGFICALLANGMPDHPDRKQLSKKERWTMAMLGVCLFYALYLMIRHATERLDPTRVVRMIWPPLYSACMVAEHYSHHKHVEVIMLMGIIAIVVTNIVYNVKWVVFKSVRGTASMLVFHLQFVLAIASCALSGAAAASGLSAMRQQGWFVPVDNSESIGMTTWAQSCQLFLMVPLALTCVFLLSMQLFERKLLISHAAFFWIHGALFALHLSWARGMSLLLSALFDGDFAENVELDDKGISDAVAAYYLMSVAIALTLVTSVFGEESRNQSTVVVRNPGLELLDPGYRGGTRSSKPSNEASQGVANLKAERLQAAKGAWFQTRFVFALAVTSSVALAMFFTTARGTASTLELPSADFTELVPSDVVQEEEASQWKYAGQNEGKVIVDPLWECTVPIAEVSQDVRNMQPGDEQTIDVLSTETTRLLNQPAHVLFFVFASLLFVHFIKPAIGRHVIALAVIVFTSVSLLFSVLLIPLVMVSVRSMAQISFQSVSIGPMERYAHAVWMHLVLLLLAVFVLVEALFPMVSSRVIQREKLASALRKRGFSQLENAKSPIVSSATNLCGGEECTDEKKSQ